MIIDKELILGFFSVILIIGIVIVIIYTTRERSNYVRKENCNRPLGEFAVEPGFTSTNIINSCFNNNSQPCIFTNIENLVDAVNKCNQYLDVCDRFIYNKNINTVSFISSNSNLDISNVSDVYTRQVGVTQN